MKVLPNLVYIGPDKAGSTWLFHLLSHHADVYVTPAKDLYFFDKYYERGLHWYARQFAGAGAGHKFVAEISHDYLYTRRAARRLSTDLPNAKLIVCLREPCERTFSAYLHLVKSGRFTGTFEEAVEAFPGIVNRSRYGKHLAMYLDYFPPEQICCTVFDDLKDDPQRYADRLFLRLGLPTISLPEHLLQKELPAGRSRSVLLTKLVKKAADAVRRAGMPQLVGRVKTSTAIQHLLYTCYSANEKPRIAPRVREQLRAVFAPDVALLDETMGTNLTQRWAYRERYHDNRQNCLARQDFYTAGREPVRPRRVRELEPV